jgi:hypothetical protein
MFMQHILKEQVVQEVVQEEILPNGEEIEEWDQIQHHWTFHKVIQAVQQEQMVMAVIQQVAVEVLLAQVGVEEDLGEQVMVVMVISPL